jgi:hypothetical protein
MVLRTAEVLNRRGAERLRAAIVTTTLMELGLGKDKLAEKLSLVGGDPRIHPGNRANLQARTISWLSNRAFSYSIRYTLHFLIMYLSRRRYDR